MPLPGLHEVVWEDREYLGWRDPVARDCAATSCYWRGETPVGFVLRAAESRAAVGMPRCARSATRRSPPAR